MKLKIKSLFVVMLTSVLLLSGCGASGFTVLAGGPNATDTVAGNGGNVVVKGSYLYFVNGYTDGSTLTDGDNEYNKQDKSSIYRTELDSNGDIIYDEDGNIEDAELVIPKIVGFENGSFYIYGDTIYYTSPNIEKDTNGNDRFDWITFYSANLNGGDVTEIYTAEATIEREDFEIYDYNNKVYIVVLQDTNLKVINASSSNGETVAKGVDSVAFADCDEFIGDVYYSRQLNDDDNSVLENGNVFAMTSVITADEEIIAKNGNTYTAVEFKNGAVYYNLLLDDGLNTCLYSREVDEVGFSESEEVRLTATKYSSVLILDYVSDNSRGIIANSGTDIYRITDIYSTAGYEVIYEGSATLLFTQGQWVYFYSSDDETKIIKRVNYETLEIEVITSGDDNLLLDINSNVDYDSTNLYYYVEYTNDNGTSYYLNMMDFMDLGSEENEDSFVGVFTNEDMPDEEDK